jgi:ABC-type transporter Mla subunit MlaD
MTEWRIPGMPRVPGLGEALALMQAQAESLSDLPAAMGELNRAVGGLTDALEATKQAAASAERTTARVERILDEIEGPILALRPGLERVARVLDDPAIDRIPATLAAIEATVLPIAEGVHRARARYGVVKARGRAMARRARERRTAPPRSE